MATALRTAVFRASRPCPQLRNDLASEIVAGFLNALLHADPATPRLASRLWWAAYSAGLKARRREYDARSNPLPEIGISSPLPVAGHPDLVLAKARLQHEPLRTAAKRHGLTYIAGKQRRWRAETRILAYLGHRCLIGLHPDTPNTTPALA